MGRVNRKHLNPPPHTPNQGGSYVISGAGMVNFAPTVHENRKKVKARKIKRTEEQKCAAVPLPTPCQSKSSRLLDVME